MTSITARRGPIKMYAVGSVVGKA